MSVNASSIPAGEEHQVGQQVSEKDAAPEFHAKVLPAGSAPASKTFTANPVSETPGQSADAISAGNTEAGTTTSASDTLVGATSADVHTGYGHPGQGQSSAELRDNSSQSAGLQGRGASGAPHHGQDERDTKDFSQAGSQGAAEQRSGLNK